VEEVGEAVVDEVADVTMTDVVAGAATMIAVVSGATPGSTTGGGAGRTPESADEREVAATPGEEEEDEAAASPEAEVKRKVETVTSQDKDSMTLSIFPRSCSLCRIL